MSAIAGGKTEVDSAEWPAITEKVTESLARLAAQDNTAQLNLAEIHSVQTQVVAGRLYHIKAKLTFPNGEHKVCNIKIWEQPWRNFQQVDIEGDDDVNVRYQLVRNGEGK